MSAAIFDPNTLDLQRKERQMLDLLISRSGKYTPRERLVHELYGDDPDGGPECGETNIYAYMSRLRKKLEPYRIVIESRRFDGYRIWFPSGVDVKKQAAEPLPCPLNTDQVSLVERLADGKQLKQIAFEDGISLTSAHLRIKAARAAAGDLNTNSALVAKAVRNGWIS